MSDETRRAEAWKTLALETRRVLGDAFGLLGECQAHLEMQTHGQGWCITAEYCALAADLMGRVEGCIDAANVPIPGAIARELRQIDAARDIENGGDV